jgi:hypothetical protein
MLNQLNLYVKLIFHRQKKKTKIKFFFFQIGNAISKNPGYLKIRKIRAAQNIAKTVCK